MVVSTQFPPKKIPAKKGFNISFTKKLIKKTNNNLSLKKITRWKRGRFLNYIP
jgi:hypothetical protein